MHSTYLTHGGREREEVFGEVWRLLRARLENGSDLHFADLEAACQRLRADWGDTEREVLASLQSRAYRALLESVDALVTQADKRRFTGRDLSKLVEAHKAWQAVEALGAALVEREYREAGTCRNGSSRSVDVSGWCAAEFPVSPARSD